MKKALALARKETKDVLRNRQIMFQLILGGVGFPIGYAALMLGLPPRAVSSTVPLYSLIVGIIPTYMTMSIPLQAFVGEKEHGTMEPLLTTPLTASELFLGKLITSIVPPIVLAFESLLLFWLSLSASAAMRHRPVVFLGRQEVLSLLGLIVLVSILFVASAVLISLRTNSTRAAGGFMMLPFFAVWGPLLALAPRHFFGPHNESGLILLGLLVLDILLARFGRRLLSRDKLLTRAS